jgi:hypothetical protein
MKAEQPLLIIFFRVMQAVAFCFLATTQVAAGCGQILKQTQRTV